MLDGGSGVGTGVFEIDAVDTGVFVDIDDVMNAGWGLWEDEGTRLGLVDANAAKADISASEL